MTQHKLPQRGQEIYRKAYNCAWDEYRDSEDRRAGRADDRKEVAHKAAWAAVTQARHKEGDQWLRNKP
jgi:cation transport regulator